MSYVWDVDYLFKIIIWLKNVYYNTGYIIHVKRQL